VKNARAKGPTVPPAHGETVRQAIIQFLGDGHRSVREISQAIHVAEKEVYGHLEHIRRSGRHIAVTPAVCRKCGYVFAKRERLTPPGRCPLCRHEAISAPLFGLGE
jgi:predicted Zn-ribbon and HTH transcriptional regulator